MRAKSWVVALMLCKFVSYRWAKIDVTHKSAYDQRCPSAQAAVMAVGHCSAAAGGCHPPFGLFYCA